ncbi:lipocalin family protein [Mucilaginibacter sp. FT3.2]|uniref:lipocalin family protein n=1 Tax=Mucilaginibacter sp. FT3.2 TaxID=2723090 RepID=UPI0016118B1E|nr:lipocalin family protein [Mucilaginibacter sp. FT3.2]MBB6234382.1 hypothetical protein [Mucilaginibacter sp. FT3.2]
MKLNHFTFICAIVLASCTPKENKTEPKAEQPLIGTWHLISSKSITNKDTAITTPSKDEEMVKIFNGTNFAFFTHDLLHGKTAKPVYSSGSGTYTLSGDDYTEHLAYCDARDWENRDFKFKVKFSGDTLVQTGIEKIDSLKVDHIIIETYIKLK